MELLLSATENSPEIQEIEANIAKNNMPLDISGLSEVHKAYITAYISQRLNRRAVIICASELAARKAAEDIYFFTHEKPLFVPARDFMLVKTNAASKEWEQQRVTALAAMAEGRFSVAVTSVSAVLSRTIPPDILKKNIFTIKPDDNIPIEELSEKLLAAGYSRCDTTEGIGQYSIRGGILDVFSPVYDNPVRIEFFGDTVDTISFFDATTQRRTAHALEAEIVPTGETLIGTDKADIAAVCARITEAADKCEKKGASKLAAALRGDAEFFENSPALARNDYFMPFVYTQKSCCADYFGDALVFLDDPLQIKEAADSFSWRMNEDVAMLVNSESLYGENAGYHFDYQYFIDSLINHKNLITLDTFLSDFSGIEKQSIVQLTAKQLPLYGSNFEVILSDIKDYIHAKYRIVMVCGGEHRAANMLKMLVENGIKATFPENPEAIPETGNVLIINGVLSSGFEFPKAKIAVLSEGTASRKERKRRSAAKSGHERVRSCADLCPGDIVVHDLYGIGRFVGIERMSASGAMRDYIKIAFQGTDVLYVPATSLDIISKYIGGGQDTNIKLNRLGGPEWKKQKAKAKASAQDMAKKLVALYAERSKLKGFAFPPDDDMQAAFEEAFEYNETDDQLKSIEEIKEDMESPQPMDRLLCGDVGYGKTEVALRAVMKCVLAGKQAAILVPTTVLARQHYLTALHRFKDTGINIDYISRFKSPAGVKKTIANVKNGTTDILIGTHKILSKALEFKDLGLLVIDEEQRFGVSHKEAIKQITKNIDVLTLSATPIPRTLGMALSGIRDMSVLEHAPEGRQPVITYVVEYSASLVLDAIRRELSRNGQVYYVHNRTESIYSVAARLRAALPDAVIGVAHGQMNEEELSDVMQKLSDGDIQVLVCTTIIETGIDVPNVNTLIVENAENFGLSQLHQLRGRVGRSVRHAFAYLTYQPGRALTEVSQKRLSAMREFAEFGAGFKIAMRDLEIRGAGNVLGAEQSGHMVSVGYDMYLRLLEEAVCEEKGEEPKHQPAECSVDFAINANIPQKFISDEKERIDIYRRIAHIRNTDDYSDLLDEIIDRYGEPEACVTTLLDIALTRSIAAECGVNELTYKNDMLCIYLAEPNLNAASLMCSLEEYKGRIMFSVGKKSYLSVKAVNQNELIAVSQKLCKKYKELCNVQPN